MGKITWQDSVAFVTGGASGIGKAISLEIAKRGGHVIVTDINFDQANAVANQCGGKSKGFGLDVRNGDAVTELVNNVYKEYGRLDFMFNNAGIAIGGETHEIAADLWNRIFDINIKGVLNGVLAAYPLMIQQGSGHIINTASLAGLGPAPFLAPYATTKHAVVGLSTSIRLEAEKYGVKVNVLCPAAIETPLLDSENPSDLSSVAWVPDMRRFLTSLAGPPYPVEKFVKQALKAIEDNVPIIVIPGRARLAWRIGRFFPSLVFKLSKKAVEVERSFRK